jgi:hypothetical protein
MYSYLLKENVLTDNVLLVASEGKVFKGGYIATVKENTFLNAWQDKETVKRFRSKEQLFKYLNKSYKEELEQFDFYGSCLE